MIRDIFLPTRIDQFYLFAETIVAFEIGSDSIRAVRVSAHRRRRIIEFAAEEHFVPEKSESFTEALSVLQKKLGKWGYSVVAIPSSKAIFKRLTVPFSNLKKIKLILPFELESVLPFSAEDAVFDCMITGTNAETGETDVFAMAFKKDVLSGYLQPFIDAGIHPDRITLNSVELYGFVQGIQNQHADKKPMVIIDGEARTTTVMLVVDGELHSVRALSEGLEDRFSRLDATNLSEPDKKTFDRLMRGILFTIQATLKNERIMESLERVFLTGSWVHMMGLSNVAEEVFKASVSILHPHLILKRENVSLEGQVTLPDGIIGAVAAAIPTQRTEQINLGTAWQEERDSQRFKAQIFTTIGLFVLLVGSISVYSFFTLRTLRGKVDRYRAELVQRLRKDFKITQKTQQLEQLLSTVDQKLTADEAIWSALTASRFSFLHYLEEMFARMDRKKWGLDLRKLSIVRDEQGRGTNVTLAGSVRDFDSLRALETALQETKLFVSVPLLQVMEFDITLLIDKSKGNRI